MSDADTTKTEGGSGQTPPPGQSHPPTPPPGGFGWHLWTLQNAAILVFMALSLAAIVIALYVVATPPPPDARAGSNPALALSILNTLLIAIAITLVFAWLSSANAQMIGRGFRHLLSIHRAAVACFVISGAATVGILIYVALAIMAAAEVAHGLYLLAAIELLLKLTAVSAIIVLITLRRTAAMVLPTAQATAQDAAVVLEEDRGRLEFGSLAFAFGLVVIAALVVPTDDLMRISAMMFGGDRKVEDYLPQRPLVRVEDDMASQIATAVQNAPGMRDLTGDMHNGQRDTLFNSIEAGIASVIYNIVGDRVKRIGAWPLFIDICQDNEDALISTNSSNKLVAEHISYLAGEGLIDFPYGDIQTLDITRHGSQVIFKNEGLACEGAATTVITTSAGASPTEFVGAAGRAERILTSAPDEIVIAISQQAESIRLALPAGDYLVSLVALDRIDPYLQVLDEQGTILAENDDGGPGVFDSALSIRVGEGQVYVARASTLDSAGNAILRVERETRLELVSAAQLVREEPAATIGESVEIPPLGAVFQFVADVDGPHVIDVVPNAGPLADLTGELFRKSGEDVESLAADDDSGVGSFPRLNAQLNAGETYYLVLQHFAPRDATTTTAHIDISPEAPPPGDGAQSGDQTEPDVPIPPPAEDAGS